MLKIATAFLLATTLYAQYTPKGPTALPAASDLLVAKDPAGGRASTLAQNMDAAQGYVDVRDGTKYAVNQMVRIGNEKMLVVSIDVNRLYVTRGFASTAAAAHNAGVNVGVEANIFEDYHNRLQSELIAWTTAMGANFANLTRRFAGTVAPSNPCGMAGDLYTNTAGNSFYRCPENNGTWTAVASVGTGDMIGPSSSVNQRIVRFTGTSGKLVEDSGTLISDLVPITRQVICATGLTGCGSWSADRTIALDINALTEKASPVSGTDWVPIYDVAGTATKKAKWPAAGTGTGSNGLTCSLNSGTDTVSCSCPASQTCNYGIGSTTYSLTDTVGTFTPTSGTSTVFIYVDTSGKLIAAHNGLTMGTCTVTGAGSSGTPCPTPTTAFPLQSIKIAEVSVSSGNFSGSLLVRTETGGSIAPEIVAGANVTVTYAGDGKTATVASSASGGGTPGGVGSGIQGRAGASSFKEVAGSSIYTPIAGPSGTTPATSYTTADGGVELNGQLRFVGTSGWPLYFGRDGTGQPSLQGGDNGGAMGIQRFTLTQNFGLASGQQGGFIVTGGAGYAIMYGVGAILLNSSGTKPTCDNTNGPNIRGLQWFAQGGAGVADSYQVCAKDASNNYAWRTLY